MPWLFDGGIPQVFYSSSPIQYTALFLDATAEIMTVRHEDDNFLETRRLLVGQNALWLLCKLDTFSGRGG